MTDDLDRAAVDAQALPEPLACDDAPPIAAEPLDRVQAEVRDIAGILLLAIPLALGLAVSLDMSAGVEHGILEPGVIAGECDHAERLTELEGVGRGDVVAG